jgi:hypothetical protein
VRSQLRRQFDSDSRTLRELWKQWDPIFDGAGNIPDEEYDCQIPPMLALLHDGGDADRLARHLAKELPDHFGLTAVGHETFARRVLDWWRTRAPLPQSPRGGTSRSRRANGGGATPR